MKSVREVRLFRKNFYIHKHIYINIFLFFSIIDLKKSRTSRTNTRIAMSVLQISGSFFIFHDLKSRTDFSQSLIFQPFSVRLFFQKSNRKPNSLNYYEFNLTKQFVYFLGKGFTVQILSSSLPV